MRSYISRVEGTMFPMIMIFTKSINVNLAILSPPSGDKLLVACLCQVGDLVSKLPQSGFLNPVAFPARPPKTSVMDSSLS